MRSRRAISPASGDHGAAGFVDGLPVGLMVTGPLFREDRVIQAAEPTRPRPSGTRANILCLRRWLASDRRDDPAPSRSNRVLRRREQLGGARLTLVMGGISPDPSRLTLLKSLAMGSLVSAMAASAIALVALVRGPQRADPRRAASHSDCWYLLAFTGGI